VGQGQHAHTHRHTRTDSHTHAPIHTHTHTHTHAHTHTHTHTHSYKHKRTPVRPPPPKAVIHFKWTAWARRFLLYELSAYVAWLASFTAFTLLFQHEDWESGFRETLASP
jgi:hypothetical protein